MLKRTILAGLLAAMAMPVLASDASYDLKAAAGQNSAATTSAHPDSPKPGCSCECQKHRA